MKNYLQGFLVLMLLYTTAQAMDQGLINIGKVICEQRDAQMALQMVKHNPSLLTKRGGEGLTVVHLAAICLSKNFFEQLSEDHTTVRYDEQDDEGNIPLHLSAGSTRGFSDTLLFLLEKSVATTQNKHGQTPLHKATLACHPTNVQIICSVLQFDPQKMHIADKDGQTPFHYCARGPRLDYRDVFKTLGKTIGQRSINPVQYTDNNGQTIAHIAAIRHRLDLLKTIIPASKELLGTKDTSGKTPLACFLASQQEDFDNAIFETLLKLGAQVTSFDKEENTLLHHAAGTARIEQFKILREKGLDPNKKNVHGQTPLLYYLMHNTSIDTKILNELFGLGAQTNVTDTSGNTLYHIAILHNHPSLLEYCATQYHDVNAKNNAGRTPLACLLARLEQSGDEQLYQALMSKKPNIREIDNDGNTMLHHAAAYGRTAIAGELKNKGLKTDTKNLAGQTPLDVCQDESTRHLLGDDNDWELLEKPQ